MRPNGYPQAPQQGKGAKRQSQKARGKGETGDSPAVKDGKKEEVPESPKKKKGKGKKPAARRKTAAGK